jgi:hypothetical protein
MNDSLEVEVLYLMAANALAKRKGVIVRWANFRVERLSLIVE